MTMILIPTASRIHPSSSNRSPPTLMSTNDSRGRGGGPSTGTTGYIGIPKQPQGGTTTYGGVPSETVYGNDEHMNQETGVVTKDEQSGWNFDYVEEPAAGGGAATDVAMPGAPLLPSGMNDNYIPVPPDMIGDMPIFDNLPPPPAFGDDAKEGGVATKPKKVIEYSSEALREIQADVKQRCSDYRGGCNARRYVSPTHAASTRRRMDVRTILPCCANCVTAGGVDWGRMVLSIYIFEPGEQCLHIQ